ncbi:tail fiber domain-containing protein [Phreatobacter oligotrophus]|uniref:Endosialidase-like protein n=1 Tax=Phreatobacter oligotrophus TaxID=1122261 RepID=A0A2T4ZIU7_9HYPH|nr:tail fiber domain-containing protein [Phreatobacter oligotrophus]PTM61912.1 endosialidase-like protein [Phreatobacter oligotrophus]
MGKSAPSAPAPDPNIGRAAVMQAETGEKWLDFSKEAFATSTQRQGELDALTKDISNRQMVLAEDNQNLARQVTEQQLALGEEQAGYARDDRRRYEQVFRPVEDKFIKQATEYDSPERQAAMAAEARADVVSSTAQQREAAQREAASMGVNPNSGRFGGLNRAADMGTALAAAGAQNTARERVRATGLALTADVANLGRGLPAQSSAAAALGLQGITAGAGTAGAAAQTSINTMGMGVGNAQQNQSLFNSSTGIMSSGFQGAMRGYAGMGDTLNRQYATQVDAWKASQMMAAQSASGFGAAIGGLAGLFMSDEEVKTDKRPLPPGMALEAVREAPSESWRYKPGVADEGEHIGPYAQDMQRATGKGDGKTIKVQDMLGLHHAAIADLDRKIDAIADAVGAEPTPDNVESMRGRDMPPERRRREPAVGIIIAAPRRGAEQREAA